MFEQHGIEIEIENVRKLFDMVDKNKRGRLDLQQFKEFNNSEEAREFFKKLIK